MPAIDTNVLVRLLMKDDPAQLATAQRLVSSSLGTAEGLFVPVTVALELEWVLRSRFGLGKTAVLRLFSQLLSTVELRFHAESAIEWALRQYRSVSTDFSDCLHAALAGQAGEQPLWTFDKAAAKLYGAQLLA
jgi:predicted nucleic-acid-binding protein